MTSLFQITLSKNIGPETVIIYPTIIKTEKLYILFDACLPNQIQQLEEELKKISISIMQLTHVFISHQDHDHIGSLAEIKRQNKNVVIVSNKIEEPYISGKEVSLRIHQANEFNKSLSGERLKWGESFVHYLQSIEPCAVDEPFNDSTYSIDSDIQIIATPGHTPGHSSLFIKSEQVLIAGDAIAVENDKLCIANPQFTLDMDRCKQTIREIAKLKPEKIYCYHGGIVENKGNSKMNELIDQMEV